MDGIAVGISKRMRTVGSDAYRDGPGIVLGMAIQSMIWTPHGSLARRAARYGETLSGCGWPAYVEVFALIAFSHGIDARFHSPGHGSENRPTPAPLLKGEDYEDLMSLESMQGKAKKVMVKLETAATGQFIMVNTEIEDEHRKGSTEHYSHRRSVDSNHDGEILPLTHLPSNGSLHEQLPAYLLADIGTGVVLKSRSPFKV